ncbi:hypothetical protein BC939DRAFT_533591 [Gamsiella multidivaricata]|uniref:uncharacterized protein n=1 Tax=Gamsiella multidivaricata TaxID=101098 RepID=UPI00221FBCD4|nr:uncharacterized protein BC939DRAFT_533591 [Gamsiella multidivaricata]KAI7816400.1 hypothetical protein BC939DRAFT_533591 [Gamsiella multidivaricata]
MTLQRLEFVKKHIGVKSHDDILLCPVNTLTEYLRRIQGHDFDVHHPKYASIRYRPLLRDVRDPSRHVGAERISNHIAFISRKLNLPKDAKLPKARAIGSTAAIKHNYISLSPDLTPRSPSVSQTYTCNFTDHDHLSLQIKPPSQIRHGKGAWRLNTSLLRQQEFRTYLTTTLDMDPSLEHRKTPISTGVASKSMSGMRVSHS